MSSTHPRELLSRKNRNRGLCLIIALGIVIFLWRLGSTGLVDETPPLFAAASRSMSRTGDWLTPRVNGLPRFDKPPLIYWLMGLGYSIPGQTHLDPLGTWSARFPSAISSIVMMVGLGDTVMQFPQKGDAFPRKTGVITALAFALSPLVLIWSRIAVSDALLCSTFGLSMLFHWRRYADPTKQAWWPGWLILSLAILTKGPIAIVLMSATLLLFGIQQRSLRHLLIKLKPLKGLLITALISIPWYLAELIIEGKAYWNSFFGYHNFQRFTSVVNNHQEPWWFFGLILVIASLPFTLLLVSGIINTIKSFLLTSKSNNQKESPKESLTAFATCWLISVLILFTIAATKLPSYWLPATPAAALIIGLTSNQGIDSKPLVSYTWIGTILIAILLSIVFWLSPLWVPFIKDPEIPNLASELIQSKLLFRSAICFSFSALLATVLLLKRNKNILISMQIPFIIFQLIVLIPLSTLADRTRQLPLRQAAQLILNSKKKSEPIVMVGAAKPSLHFYTNEIILYEGKSFSALVNIEERLRKETRQGFNGSPLQGGESPKTALILINNRAAELSHWKSLEALVLGRFSIYSIWRVDRLRLSKIATRLRNQGVTPTWQNPRPEIF